MINLVKLMIVQFLRYLTDEQSLKKILSRNLSIIFVRIGPFPVILDGIIITLFDLIWNLFKVSEVYNRKAVVIELEIR